VGSAYSGLDSPRSRCGELGDHLVYFGAGQRTWHLAAHLCAGYGRRRHRLQIRHRGRHDAAGVVELDAE
jgi:hypothetical protein